MVGSRPQAVFWGEAGVWCHCSAKAGEGSLIHVALRGVLQRPGGGSGPSQRVPRARGGSLLGMLNECHLPTAGAQRLGKRSRRRNPRQGIVKTHFHPEGAGTPTGLKQRSGLNQLQVPVAPFHGL